MSDRACVYCERDGAVLMVRQVYRGETLLTLPGGGVETGEAPDAAAERETREETGVRVSIRRLLLTCPRARGDGQYHCYEGRFLEQGEAEDRDDEIEWVGWIDLEEVRNHPEVSRMIDLLEEKSGG